MPVMTMFQTGRLTLHTVDAGLIKYGSNDNHFNVNVKSKSSIPALSHSSIGYEPFAMI